VARVVKALGGAFRASIDWLRLGGEARRAIYRTVNALASESLPGEDFEALMPFGGGVAWVRKVPGRRLWLLYRFDAATLAPLAVVDRAPVRVEPIE
jgi:hypothetical protein